QRRAQGLPSGWLSIEESDSDPQHFLASLVLSLARARVDVGELEIGARNGFPNSPPLLVTHHLVRQLETLRSPVVLVLDDYHHIDSVEIDQILRQLVRKAPPSFTLVINSRALPALDWATMLASGEALEIDPDQLRLTREETLSVLSESVSADVAQEIYTQTEGWPVAVQLARIQEATQPGFSLRPGTTGRLITSYLSEQILSSLPPKERAFLLGVAVVDRFNPALADALFRRQDTWPLLAELDSLSALIVPLNEPDQWLRLHHLFRDCLRDILRREDPERFRILLRRASAWYEARGHLVEAVVYASRTEDWARCRRLILEAGGWRIILTEGISAMRTLLRLMPDEILAQSSRLMLAKAYLHCKDGRQADARSAFDAAEARRDPADAAARRDQGAVGAIVNGYEDSDDWVGGATQRSPDAPLDELDPLDAAAFASESVVLHLARGEFSELTHALESSFIYLRRSGSVVGLNYCYLQAGIAALQQGDMGKAETAIEQALEMAEANFGADSGLKHFALILQASLRAWQGLAVREDFHDLSTALSHIEQHDGWTGIYILGLDAAYHLALQVGIPEATGPLAQRFLHLAERRNLPRLSAFSRILATRAEVEVKGDAAFHVGDVHDWLADHSPREKPWLWQTFFAGAEFLGCGPGPHIARTTGVLTHALDRAIDMSSDLHLVRLLLALSSHRGRCGASAEASQALLDAVQTASRHSLLGPFLCHPHLLDPLRQLHRDLRSDGSEPLSSAFVGRVLLKASELRPSEVQALLSAREQEVLEKLALGKTNREIAWQLEMTENTVKFHLKNLFAKLGVSRRRQAVAEARRLGLIISSN
ncbi:MAG: LuxR C-terminal-related transcriptional regulator, partial [Myxococcota bacterium]